MSDNKNFIILGVSVLRVRLPYYFGFFVLFYCVLHSLHAEENPSLIVRSGGKVSRPADQLSIHVGVVSQGNTAELALQENSEKVRRIIDALKRAGLTDKEYETGHFSIYPLYSQKPKSAGADWTPRIIGYRVNNSLTVTTEKIELAGTLLDSMTKAGANNINRVAFGLNDPRMYRSEAIAVATKNALSDAMNLSKAASVETLRILSITLDDAVRSGPLQPKALYLRSAAEGAPIESGDIEVHATVAIKFEIK